LVRDYAFIPSFVDKFSLLKPNAPDGILVIGSCHPADTIYIGWAPQRPLFSLPALSSFMIFI